MEYPMSGTVVHQPCTHPAVKAAALAVLEAILLYADPRDLDALAKAASHQGIPVRTEHYSYSLEVREPKGICWALSDGKGADYYDKVVLLLPPFINHRLRPRWDGEATVILVGDTIPEDAVDLLTALSGRLASGQ